MRPWPYSGVRGWFFAVLLTACGAEVTEPPDEAADAGFPDATAADATPNPDAETPDQGHAEDLGFLDATVFDAGTPDTGATDLGFRDASSPDAVATDSGPPDPGPAVLNPGWIGGPCASDADCNFANGRCLTAAQGYPGGLCTQDCTRFCPDQAGPQNAVTFCMEATSAQCVARCDYTLSPTGCRQGYVCLPEKRYNEPSVVRDVCVPRSGVPGRAVPPYDIGQACATDSDCERNTCLTLQGGYCTQEACDIVGCPNGASCWRLGQENQHVCLDNCTSNNDCRAAEGYQCDSDQTCWWYPPMRPTCVLSGGAQDCASWASMSASQDFVVATKGQRRLTLCRGAQQVQSFCMGLGFAPIGDKEREGDGKTPEGLFYIPRLLPNSQYYKAFLISYPDAADAARGLAQGLITQSEHNAIVAAQNNRTEPPQTTNLGGLIEIHGRGGSSDWTWGCLAIEDAQVDVLWNNLGVGDSVVILP